MRFVLLAAWIMSRIERRRLGDYGSVAAGLLWTILARVRDQLRFVDAAAVDFAARASLFSRATPASGVDILKYGFLWAVTMILATMVEEFLYRGYLQFTLTSGIGFWPAALITSALMAAAHILNPGWTVLGLCTVGAFGLIACLLLQRTGDLWMPLGLHAAWDWGETYFYGVPDSGQMGNGHLFQGSFHGPAWLTGMPFGVEAGWPNVALLLMWWFLFSRFLRDARYPKSVTSETKIR